MDRLRRMAVVAAGCSVLAACSPNLESSIRSVLKDMGLPRAQRACLAKSVARQLSEAQAASDFRLTLYNWRKVPRVTHLGEVLERVRPALNDAQYLIAEEAVRVCSAPR